MYLRRDGEGHLLLETEQQQQIKPYRAADFIPYHSYRDPTRVVMLEVQIAMAIKKRGTRQIPDPKNSRQVLGAAATKPTSWHWIILKESVRYLAGTRILYKIKRKQSKQWEPSDELYEFGLGKRPGWPQIDNRRSDKVRKRHIRMSI